MIPTVAVTQYVTPLREGGSLPGLVEAEDLGTYVCKFRGAGQGQRVLVAEVIVAELARTLGLRTPRQVALDLNAAIARYEADEEVQDLLNASLGTNLGIDFLPGAFGFDGAAADAGEAALVLWLDAFTANVDRTWRNPNLLVWHGDLWLIDHGASLYFHHAWATGLTDPERFAHQAWDPSGHVFLSALPGLGQADQAARAALGSEQFAEAVAQVPDGWLDGVPQVADPAALRAAYVTFLEARLETRDWLPGGTS